MIKEVREPLQLLKKSNRFNNYSNIVCWKEEHNGLPIYIFSIEINTENIIENLWHQINNDIALYFQSEIENEISRWNIYIFFFIKESVKPIIKYTIEQNKYCARKIVVDNFKKLESVEAFIEKRLFSLDIPEENNKNEKSLIETIIEKNKTLADIVNSDDDINIILERYLEEQL